MKFFIAHAEKDSSLSAPFIEDLKTWLKLYFPDSESWDYRDLVVGSHSDAEIKHKLEECDFGIFLLSPNSLTSDYIVNRELPILIEAKKLLPIGLVFVQWQVLERFGVHEAQVHLLRQKGVVGGKWWIQCNDEILRAEFLDSLIKGLQFIVRVNP